MDPFSPPPTYPSLRVMIADDKPFIRSIVQGMLLRLKVKGVMQASNGEQAVKLLRKYTHRIGCIISDWNMDPIGGLELLRTVRAGQIPGLPASTCFIMLTGHARESVVKAALALDVHAYLVKPVSFEKLVKTLEAALSREIHLRQSLYYRSIVDVEVPGAVKSADRHIPPWVTWIVKSPKRADLEERLKQIRREAADTHSKAANEDDTENGIEIKNMRRLLMEEIKPGCVLAEDVYANDRDLLVAAGTVLSNGLLSRLKEIAAGGGQEARLWVGDA
jgi:two-component system chemotaxis response regulator CheY